MDYQQWLPLFGLAASDSKVVSALAAAGVTAPVELPFQTFTTGVDFKPRGLGVGFTAEMKLREGGSADLPILSSVVMMTAPSKKAKGWAPYAGPLPHGLAKGDGKDDIVAKLGPPTTLDDFFNSAGWVIDGLRLGVLFTDDWKTIKQLGLMMPGAV